MWLYFILDESLPCVCLHLHVHFLCVCFVFVSHLDVHPLSSERGFRHDGPSIAICVFCPVSGTIDRMSEHAGMRCVCDVRVVVVMFACRLPFVSCMVLYV